MKYLKQFGIILVLSFIGELLNHVLPLPVPSSIYGIILMFICLKTGLIPLEEVDEMAVAGRATQYMIRRTSPQQSATELDHPEEEPAEGDCDYGIF